MAIANPQAYTYTTSDTRTVEVKADIPNVVGRVSIEETPIFNLFPHIKANNVHRQMIEDDLQAINTDNAYAEDSPAPAATSTARTKVENYCQLFKSSVLVTNTQRAQAQYGVDDEYDYQLGLRLLEIKRDIEAVILSDQVLQAPTASNGRIAKMNGMSAIISTNTDAVADYNLTNLDWVH